MLGFGCLGQFALGEFASQITATISATFLRTAAPTLQQIRVSAFTLQQERVTDSNLTRLRSSSPLLQD